VAADAELRRRHPDQPYLPLRSAEPVVISDEQRGEVGKLITDLAAAHRTFAERLADRQSLTVPSPDPGYGDLGQAFPPWPGQAGMRSCSRRSQRSGRPRKCSNAPQTATPTGKPETDAARSNP